MSNKISENCDITLKTAFGSAVCISAMMLLTLTIGCAQTWVPRHAHPKNAHVIATDKANVYRPAPGYDWVDPDGSVGPVKWVPGKKHSQYAHVVAAEKEGYFHPAPGYDWVDPDGSAGPVRWVPGKKHSQYAHVVAAEKEGYFQPEPGYDWDTPGKFGPVHLIAEQGSVVVASEAEALRRFLAANRLFNPTHSFNFSQDLHDLYSIKSQQSETEGCPLPNFRDQPTTASDRAINVFVIDFKSNPESVCRNAPNPASCLAIQDSCIAVETSIFCDLGYLDRRASIAQLTYYFAWKGLGRIQDGEPAGFIPLSHDALIDLAKMTIAARNNQDYPMDLKIVPTASLLATQAESSVYNLTLSISLIAPILHEVAHIEQNYCGRGISKEGNYDFVSRLMLTGERDYKKTVQFYEALTCSHLSLNEIDADWRSMDMILLYMETEVPNAIKSPSFKFGTEVTNKTRRELQGLVRWSREVAMLGILHGSEYELLIYTNPEKGLKLVRGEPKKNLSPEQYINYYTDAGMDPTISPIRGHLEPAYRTVELSSALNMKRFFHVNRGNTLSIAHMRIAPFAFSRFISMRRNDCGIFDTNESFKAIGYYVFSAFQDENGSVSHASSSGRFKEAYALLERFMKAGGADRKALTEVLKPSRADYEAIFEQPFAEKAYRNYAPYWENGEMLITMRPEETELVIYESSSDELRKYGHVNNLQRGYRDISNVIKPGFTIYSWRYRRPGAHFGMAYDGLYFVNDHWVWVPKPYRVE